MATSDILKPKSIDFIKDQIYKFSKYRIKFIDGKGKLQYRKKVKFLWFSYHIWKYVKHYKFNFSLNKITKQYIIDDFNNFIARNPIAEDYMKKTYEFAYKKYKENKPNRHVYLNKKLLITNDHWTTKYIEIKDNDNVDDILKEYFSKFKE